MNLQPSPDTPPPEGVVTPEVPAAPVSRRSSALIPIVLLAILATLPYLNMLRNGFVYDDWTQVVANPYVRDSAHLREIFTTSVWSYVGDYRARTNYYRPVMLLGYLLCYAIFGPRPFGFHLASLLLNAAVVCALFLLTRRMFRSSAIALWASALFAVHPIHSEALDWIAAVTELQLAFFYLTSFWLFLVWGGMRRGVSWAAGLGMAGTFVAALLSKEQALTLPLLATLYEHSYRDDRQEASPALKALRYGPLWVITLVYLGVRIRLLGAFAPDVTRRGLSSGAVFLGALSLVGRYLWKMIWPVRLCAYYVYPADVASLLPWSLAGLLGLGLCTGLFFLLWKVDRRVSFGLVWFLVTLAPVLNARWMPANTFTERYLYLPSAGFCWIAGWAGVRAWRRLSTRGSRWRWALAGGLSALGALCVLRIVTRNLDWKDDVTFYSRTLQASPTAYYMYNNLGAVYWKQDNVAAAEEQWRKAEELSPENELVLNNLGLVAYRQKRYAEAEAYFLRALRTKADYSDAHLHLGQTYEKMGMPQEAELQLRAAVSLSPFNTEVRNSLGNLLFDAKRYREAEEQYRSSLQIQPTTWGCWGLGFISWMNGDKIQAERFFQEAEAVEPSNARTHSILGMFYSDTGRSSEAARELKTALQIDPNDPETLATLKKLKLVAPDAKP